MPIDQSKLNELLGRVVGDFGAAMSAALVSIGDRLGLYKALADLGKATPAALAARAKINERLAREWLLNRPRAGTSSTTAPAGATG